MKNKKEFLEAYEKLSPLQAFNFAHEVAMQLNHMGEKDSSKHNPNSVSPCDVSYSINQAFELMALTLLDYYDGNMPEERFHNENQTQDIRLKKPLI